MTANCCGEHFANICVLRILILALLIIITGHLENIALKKDSDQIRSDQSLSRVRLFVTHEMLTNLCFGFLIIVFLFIF